MANPAATAGRHGIGGTLELRRRLGPVALRSGFTGLTRSPHSGWLDCCQNAWVLDLLHHGRQRQRIGRGRPFDRLSGVAALYAPGRDYHEWREVGHPVDESWIVFDLHGAVGAAARRLVGRAGYCHFQDPDAVIGPRLRAVGRLLFERRPGFDLVAQGLALELLGHLVAAAKAAPRRRLVRALGATRPGAELRERVEHFIRGQIARPLGVGDLARELGLSRSALAHRYPRLAGESPYRTIQRLKVEAAKRLLLEGGLTVKECAAQLGFSSEFHFSRLFKRLEGLAPRAYRQALEKGQH
jgi:AraC-like DNA-binding protein